MLLGCCGDFLSIWKWCVCFFCVLMLALWGGGNCEGVKKVGVCLGGWESWCVSWWVGELVCVLVGG